MSKYENELCKVETGEISVNDGIARQCLESIVGRFLNREIDVNGVIVGSNPITEYEGPGETHNACVSCTACDRVLNVGQLPGGTRVSVATISEVDLFSTPIPETE